jgi:hypothetical protein
VEAGIILPLSYQEKLMVGREIIAHKCFSGSPSTLDKFVRDHLAISTIGIFDRAMD